MGGYRAGRASWVDPGFYPISSHLSDGFDETVSPVFLVDVGGGQGHDLHELHTKYGTYPGNLILQDQAGVVSQIPKDPKPPFEAIVHDFFTSQPVHYARDYFPHFILHDWSDEDCVKILSHVTPAMKKGYSKLLLYKIAIPELGAEWPATSMDWLMLVLGGTRERRLSEWEALLGRVGLKVVAVYTYEGATESVIEAELA
jgi:hypothetical protein